MSDITDDEATILDLFLPAWMVHKFATDYKGAVKWEVESQHGCFNGDWGMRAKPDGIHWEDRGEPRRKGVITWQRVRAAVLAICTPESLAELGAAVEAHRANSFLSTQQTWAEQKGEPGPIADKEAHRAAGCDLYWEEWQAGYEIKRRWFEAPPVVQLDFLDLIGAST